MKKEYDIKNLNPRKNPYAEILKKRDGAEKPSDPELSADNKQSHPQ